MGRADSIQEHIFQQLRDQIIHLERLPGSAMSVYEVSDQMGVSRTPVREAFIRLEAESLVHILPQRKTQVSKIDFGRVRQEHFLRTALETAALKTFLEKAGTAQFGRMRQMIELQKQAAESNDAKRLLDYDDRFHQVIFEVANQPLSWNVIHDLNGHDRRVRMMMVRDYGEAQHSIGEHESLLRAFETGDAAGAARRLNVHLESLIIQENTLREKYADFFEEA